MTSLLRFLKQTVHAIFSSITLWMSVYRDHYHKLGYNFQRNDALTNTFSLVIRICECYETYLWIAHADKFFLRELHLKLFAYNPVDEGLCLANYQSHLHRIPCHFHHLKNICKEKVKFKQMHIWTNLRYKPFSLSELPERNDILPHKSGRKQSIKMKHLEMEEVRYITLALVSHSSCSHQHHMLEGLCKANLTILKLQFIWERQSK